MELTKAVEDLMQTSDQVYYLRGMLETWWAKA